MKKLHKIIAASLLASAATAGTGVVLAESSLTSNVAVGSNYIWRGVTQSNDTSAVSGGIDYAASGFYAGAWWSSLEKAQYEQDLYLGYGGDAGPISYDVGYIAYQYPIDPASIDFSEVYVNLGFGPATLGYAKTVGVESGSVPKDSYLSLSTEFEVKKDLMLGVTVGSYDFEAADSDYTHYQVSLSKGDFSLAFDRNNKSGAADKSARVTVSYSKGFDL